MTIESISQSAKSEAVLKSSTLYPPPPLDKAVESVFPNRRLSVGPKPNDVWQIVSLRLWNAFLLMLALCGSVIPVVFLSLDREIPRWFISWYAVVALGPLFLSLPIRLLLFLSVPPPPIVAEPPPMVNGRSTAVAVDILVTSYKEALDELAGTLAAIQNVVWKGPVNVYVLDDASRGDVANLCEGMRSAKRPVTRITRIGNSGKKAGNVNNFLKIYERTADFFVILDCDMRPFPNMLQLLFGAYFDDSESDRRRTGFITTPQFFRNYGPSTDCYDMLSWTWINNIMPCMAQVHCAPFIGTNALWCRDAIERAGYFFTNMATEDVATGCKVHTTENAEGDKYVSKYLSLPIAAGLNPRTLAELMNQHTRWNIGQCQMTVHFRGFLFNSQLRPAQRFVYFSTMAGWTRHILTFWILYCATVFFNIASASILVSPGSWQPPPLTIIAIGASIILPLLSWVLLSGSTFRAGLRGVQMGFVYITTEMAGVLAILGFDVPVLFASDCNAARWHPHFLFHISVYVSIFGSAVYCIASNMLHKISSPWPYIQPICSVLLWTFAFFPVLMALLGHENTEETKWLALEEGRDRLFHRPVWADNDKISLEQLKSAVSNVCQRIEKHHLEIKELQLPRQGA